MTLIPLLIILGPTAVGKTELALALGAALNGEIIGADSRQVYRQMDIGTAKPSPEQMAVLPHHLIDIVDPDDTFTSAQWQDEAAGAISAIHARGKLPMVVGGTGQYLVGLLDGWVGPRVSPDPSFRRQLEAELAADGLTPLVERLRTLDAAAAHAIDPRNGRRVIRALEVIQATGQPFSAQRTRQDTPYAPVIVGLQLARDQLYARADARLDRMMREGFLNEVETLLAHGYARDLPAMSGIGYRQLAGHVLDGTPLEQALQETRRGTRRTIRNQDSWFRQLGDRVEWVDRDALDVDMLLGRIAARVKAA